jgi:hypothetical protein
MSKFAGLALEVDKPARMPIRHPATGEPIRNASDPKDMAYVDVYSSDSEIARRHRRMFGQKRLDAMARKRKATVRIEDFEESDTELLVALTAGWRLIGIDGVPIDVEYSAQHARELYESPAMAWLRDQVDEFAAERENFSKASPTN